MLRRVSFVVLAMGLGMTSCGGKEDKSVAQKDENTNMVKEQKTVVDNKVTAKRETTTSGLSYEVLKAPAADAKSPSKGSVVEVHYTGWLNKDGKEGAKFDSSVDRGMTFKFTLGAGEVIPGWDEGVALMKVGGKYRLFLPSKLGYGPYGAGNVIPPNADLIFDVELISC